MLQFMGLQRVGQDLVTEQQQLACQRMCTFVNLIHRSQMSALETCGFLSHQPGGESLFPHAVTSSLLSN